MQGEWGTLGTGSPTYLPPSSHHQQQALPPVEKPGSLFADHVQKGKDPEGLNGHRIKTTPDGNSLPLPLKLLCLAAFGDRDVGLAGPTGLSCYGISTVVAVSLQWITQPITQRDCMQQNLR